MWLAIALTVAAMPSQVRAAELLALAFKIPKGLFYLAEVPSGAMFCSKPLSRRQTKAFDQRFGDRFNRLIDVVERREGLGWSPGDVVVTPCLRSSRAQAAAMLTSFERELSAYEARYDLSAPIQ